MIESEDFLAYMVKQIVDNPDDVSVVKTVDDMGVLLTLSVNQEDMGQVIGREGNNAKALRSLIRVHGMKSNARVNVRINEPNKEESASAE